MRGVRVGNRADAEMINVSSTGVLMQCQARLVPGQQTTLQIVGANNRFKLHGRVVRCEVAGLSGDLQYHVSVAGVGAYVDAGGLMQTGLTVPNPVAAARGDPCAPRRGRGARTCASCRRETFTRAASDRCRHR